MLIPVLGVFLMIKGDEILNMIAAALGGRTDLVTLLLCAVLMLLSTMNDIAVPSVSLEGKGLWILQSLSVEAKTVLRAKTAMHLLLTVIPLLFSEICAAIVWQAPLAEKLLLFVVPLVFAIFMALFGSFLGVWHATTEWTTEIIPLKQSAAVTIALFGGWGFVALFALPYFLLGSLTGIAPYLIAWAVVFAAASVPLYRWLMTKGAETFSRL